MGTEGLAEVFAQHRRRLEALARGLLRNKEDAADVVSDAFVAFIERGPRDRAEAGAWLYVVTRNKALNRVRDQARAARRPLPIAEPVLQAAPVDSRVVSLLERAAEKLSARDVRALEFRYRLGLDYDEIAAAMGVSAATCRVLVHRASRRLRGQTVGLLADHHGASVSCRSELLRSAVHGRIREHDGCPACNAVADEVQALVARGVLAVPVPLSDRLIDNPLSRWFAAHLPGRVATPSPRAAEAIAALVVSGAIAVGGGGSMPMPAVSAPVAIHAAALDTDASHPTSRIDTAPVVTAVVEPVAAAVEDIETFAADNALDVEAFEDAANDNAFVADVFRIPELLGVPLLAADALDLDLPPSIDVRTLRIGTTPDAAGRPAGLYFRIGVAGPVDGLASYNVGFDVGGTPCHWSISIRPDVDGGGFAGDFATSFSESCSPRRSQNEVLYDAGLVNGMIEYAPYAPEFAEWREQPQLSAVTSGWGVALHIPFDAMSERAQKHIRSATELRGVEISASGWGDPRFSDRAPDNGDVTYKIER